jgi:hypothetical protein
MLKAIFGDEKIAKKWIVTKAMELVRKFRMSLSKAFKKAWHEVYVMFKNQCYFNMKLFIEGQSVTIATDLANSLTDSLEIIEDAVHNKDKIWNWKSWIRRDKHKLIDKLLMSDSEVKFEFGRDVYFVEV